MNNTLFDTLSKVLALVDRSTHWQAVGMIGVILLGALLEALGIGLIFPFIQVIIDPERLHQMAWITAVFGPVPADGEQEYLVLLTACLLGFFLVKNLILIVVYYAQARFIVNNEALLAERLFYSYLNGAYSLHLSRNSSELIRNVSDTVEGVFSGVGMGFMAIAAEICVVIGIVVILLVAEPLLTLAAVAIAILGMAVFYAMTRHRFSAWGAHELDVKSKIIQCLQQGFHNIQEIKVLGREGFITEDFAKPRAVLSRLRVINNVMAYMPRLWVETLMVTGTLAVVIYVLLGGNPPAEILATLALFGAATIRFVPSMNRILGALSNIRRSQKAVETVSRDIDLFGKNIDRTSTDDGRVFLFEDTLKVENLSFRYPDADGIALDDVNLVIPKGQSVGLVGPSGAGKSTMVNVILGLLTPSSGRVLADGTDIMETMRAWRRQFGFVPQSIYLTDDTLRRNIAFGLADGDIDDEKVWHAVRVAQLEKLVKELPNGLDTSVGEHGARFSSGQRQRIGIARALYHDPEILILDEATSALDNETEREISDAIERLRGQKTLIIIAHRLSTVRRCDRLVFFDDGRIVDTGSFNELVEGNARFRKLVELAAL